MRSGRRWREDGMRKWVGILSRALTSEHVTNGFREDFRVLDVWVVRRPGNLDGCALGDERYDLLYLLAREDGALFAADTEDRAAYAP